MSAFHSQSSCLIVAPHFMPFFAFLVFVCFFFVCFLPLVPAAFLNLIFSMISTIHQSLKFLLRGEVNENFILQPSLFLTTLLTSLPRVNL